MEDEKKKELVEFINNLERDVDKLNSLKDNIEDNEFDIKMLAQDINVSTNDFLYEVYGVKVHTEYPE